MARGKRKSYSHNRPARSRRKTVRVKGYCRRKGLTGWLQRDAANKGMPF